MKPAFALTLGILFSLNAHGQDSLGRLFHTPAERIRLDAMRTEAIARANRPVPAVTEEAPRAPAPRTLTLNGIVRRSDGEATVWVNGKAMDAAPGTRDVMPGSLGRDAAGFHLSESGRRVRLKVGQSVEATSGVIEESYSRRRTLPVASAPAASPVERDRETEIEPETDRPAAPRPPRRGGRNDRDPDYEAGR